jgi:phage terminase Nu1 subunit (DNA packaging protein)
MKFWLKIIALAVILILVSIWAKPVLADDTNTQTNTSGSNTNITGGYESTTTNNNDGQTNTTTNTTTSTTNGSDVPPPSANSPSYSSMSQDVCSMGVSGSISTGVVGFSGGKHFVDENCERIKLAKVLQDFGMKVASVAVLCQDKRVFQAMEAAGTPCPYQGKIGPEAAEMWKKYVELRPDYKEHLEKQKVIDAVDERLAEEARIEAERIAAEEAEAARIEAERIEQELLTLKEENEVNAIEPVVDPVPVIVERD